MFCAGEVQRYQTSPVSGTVVLASLQGVNICRFLSCQYYPLKGYQINEDFHLFYLPLVFLLAALPGYFGTRRVVEFSCLGRSIRSPGRVRRVRSRRCAGRRAASLSLGLGWELTLLLHHKRLLGDIRQTH